MPLERMQLISQKKIFTSTLKTRWLLEGGLIMGPMFSSHLLESPVKRCINKKEHKQKLMKSECASWFAGARLLGNLDNKIDG